MVLRAFRNAQASYKLVIANSNWDTANSNWDVILNYTRKLLNYTKKHPVKAGISLISLVFLMGMTMSFHRADIPLSYCRLTMVWI